MKKGFLIKVFDGRKEKFVANQEAKKVLTGDARKAHIYTTKEDAEKELPSFYIADAIGDIFWSGFMREEAVMTIIEVAYI